MRDLTAPYHAHVYYEAGRAPARSDCTTTSPQCVRTTRLQSLLFVGELRDRSVGPHPKPQFEIHFVASALPRLVSVLERPD